jgi:hypothetical protein
MGKHSSADSQLWVPQLFAMSLLYVADAFSVDM